MEISKNVQDVYNGMILNSAECDELLNNDEYAELQKQHSEVLKKIASLIPEEGQVLLQQLDDIEYGMDRIEQSVLYQNGLRDGVQMLKILKVI
jgi:hypothetical protein